ncbi:MAG TPA: SURF1 family protein [Steroidobacteraceae bacterium]
MAAVAAALSCANWQFGRAAEKRELIASFDRGLATNSDLGSGTVDALPRYQHVTARGHYDPSRQVLLDNMPSSDGYAGYRVLTPFVRPGSAKLLLVDRGWVPLGLSRERLPLVGVADGMREVAGRLDQLPVPGIRVGTAGTPGDTRWPRVLMFPTALDLEQVFGAPVESRIVLLDADQPDGYQRVWRPALEFPPERHLGYAVQWIALAIVAIVIFIALSLQPALDPESTRS